MAIQCILKVSLDKLSTTRNPEIDRHSQSGYKECLVDIEVIVQLCETYNRGGHGKCPVSASILDKVDKGIPLNAKDTLNFQWASVIALAQRRVLLFMFPKGEFYMPHLHAFNDKWCFSEEDREEYRRTKKRGFGTRERLSPGTLANHARAMMHLFKFMKMIYSHTDSTWVLKACIQCCLGVKTNNRKEQKHTAHELQITHADVGIMDTAKWKQYFESDWFKRTCVPLQVGHGEFWPSFVPSDYDIERMWNIKCALAMALCITCSKRPLTDCLLKINHVMHYREDRHQGPKPVYIVMLVPQHRMQTLKNRKAVQLTMGHTLCVMLN